MRIELRGADELRAALISKALDKAAAQIVRYHAAQLQQKAQELAPVDTGHLKRSIFIKIESNGVDTTGIIRAEANYSGYVEKGTRFMDAQPFLFPAQMRVKPAFLRDIRMAARKVR